MRVVQGPLKTSHNFRHGLMRLCLYLDVEYMFKPLLVFAISGGKKNIAVQYQMFVFLILVSSDRSPLRRSAL